MQMICEEEGDYEAFYEETSFEIFKGDKQWTTEEIFEEVQNVIDQFIFWDKQAEEVKQ